MTPEILTTERLLLRKWTPDEFRYLFEHFTKEDIIKELGLTTDDEYTLKLAKYTAGYTSYKRSLVYFQVVDKQTNETIGACGFHNWMMEHNRSEMGYHLNSDHYKRRGIMTEVLKVVIPYGFNNMGLNRIEACTSPNNLASINLLKKCGFAQEGYLRQHHFREGVLHDSLLFSLLKEEYSALNS